MFVVLRPPSLSGGLARHGPAHAAFRRTCRCVVVLSDRRHQSWCCFSCKKQDVCCFRDKGRKRTTVSCGVCVHKLISAFARMPTTSAVLPNWHKCTHDSSACLP
ncbi:unnamed protein product [Ectocarpus sp. 13 AM-2016]